MNIMANGPATAPDQKTRLKSIIGGSAGNLVEWYDWYVYSAFTLYFAPVFFPSGNQTAELLSAAAVFAVGFLMRPIGAWFMGTYADRKGRKAGLTLSVTLMCLGSFLIAITPGHETIGIAAPAILVFARLLQGISVGGEYGTSATYLSEMAGKSRRGFFSSFQYVTLISGQLLALAVLLLLQRVLTPEQLGSWGWRIPFFIGGMLAIAVFYIRRGLAETQSFENAKAGEADKPKSSGWALFKHYPREAMMVMALTSGGTLAFYAYTTYLQKFLVNTSGFSKESATEITTAALFVFMLCQPLRLRAVGQGGPQAVDGGLRHSRNAVYLSHLQYAGDDDGSDHGFRSGAGRAFDRHRLHLHQCGGEGGNVPRPYPRARRGSALCAGEHDLRRNGGIRGPEVQADRT